MAGGINRDIEIYNGVEINQIYNYINGIYQSEIVI